MKRKAIRKYNNGTSGVSVQNYMQSPADIIAENDIMMAKAELAAQTNPWAVGVEVGSSLLSSVVGAGAVTSTGNPVKAANGSSGIQGPDAEVEGGEAFETPTGEVGEFKGPGHEQGGMPMNIVPPDQPITEGALPEQTKIYSERMIKDGKKLSDRKLSRDKKQSKLEKMLEGNSDIAIKNAAQRKLASLEREDQEDLSFQELASAFDGLSKFAFGTGAEGVQKFYAGTPGVTGDPDKSNYDATIDAERIKRERLIEDFKAGEEALGVSLDEERDAKNLTADTDFLKSFSTEGFKSVDTGVGKGLPAEKTPFDKYVPKIGDAIGMVGNYISAFDPMKNTLENRAGDSPNTNEFKDFGKDSLETLDKAGENLSLQKDISKQRLLGQARASKKAGRAGARGINQVRATDFLTDMGTNQGDQNIDLSYANSVMDLLAKKSGLQSNIDQVVMGGEQAKDLANRQDRDNFYTQMSKDIATKGQGVQQMGKDMNDIAMNPQVLALLQQLGKYVSYDAKGQLIAKTT